MFVAPRVGRRTPTRARAVVRTGLDLLGRLALAILVAFHAWLLWNHVVEGLLLDPPTAVRWGLSILILLGFRALHASGRSMLSGRRAVGLWLVVVLLHASALAGSSPREMPLVVPEAATALAQLVVPGGLLLGALALACLVLAARAARTASRAFDIVALDAARPAAVALLRRSPRAPPLSAATVL